jgi:prolipoprotein diacylglyceryl transferase
MGVIPFSLPSPSSAILELGPISVRHYALAIILGVVVAVTVGSRRAQAMGAPKPLVSDVAVLAVPFGVIGGRIYHVITTPEPYFGSNGDLVSVFFIWEGGLGIWGAIAFGAVGALIAFRYFERKGDVGISFAQFADAIAPGILFAQAIGRFGNWFNQELFGRPTDLPWGLEIESRYRPFGYSQFETFHPTFLYEALWTTLIAIFLIKVTTRFASHPGRIFALYVALYSIGRLFIEQLRIDAANEILGLRLNTWTSLVVTAVALIIFSKLKPMRDKSIDSQ